MDKSFATLSEGKLPFRGGSCPPSVMAEDLKSCHLVARGGWTLSFISISSSSSSSSGDGDVCLSFLQKSIMREQKIITLLHPLILCYDRGYSVYFIPILPCLCSRFQVITDKIFFLLRIGKYLNRAKFDYDGHCYQSNMGITKIQEKKTSN